MHAPFVLPARHINGTLVTSTMINARLLGLVSIQLLSRTLITKYCDWLFERGPPVWNAPNFFRCLVATSTFKGNFCRLQHIHVHVKEKAWEVIYRLVNEKESKTYSRSFCTDTFFYWRSKFARGMCEADPDCARASLVLRRLSLVFVFHQFRQEIGG